MLYQKAFVAGTFDNFHVGHQYLLYQVSQLADKFVVVVARDATVKRIKGRLPVFSEGQRKQRIEQEFYSKMKVKLGRSDADFFQILQEEKPDVLCLGYDQRFNEKKCQELFPHLKIVRLQPFYPEIFKSSKFLSTTV
ncbi:hypothetical protein CSB37_00065 [bacterium DOLZORAL124_38_8]|nr:MAG: hypothetical protein CSB37_00065 [bacterium DOLZORAL124_38_8]